MNAYQIAGWVLVGAVAGAVACWAQANMGALFLLRKANRVFDLAIKEKKESNRRLEDYLGLGRELQDLHKKYGVLQEEHIKVLQEMGTVREDLKETLEKYVEMLKKAVAQKSSESGKVT